MNLSDEKSLELLMREWEVDLQTQMHFNELIMKFRTAGLTIVGLFLSAAVGALKFDKTLSIGIGLAAVALLIAFWILDSRYYFKLLIGAVNRTQRIDELFSSEEMFLNINKRSMRLFGLTRSITDEIDKEAVSKNYLKSRLLIAGYYSIMLIAAALIFTVVITHGCEQKKSPKSSKSERAINLVKDHPLQYPGFTTIEKDIQLTLTQLEGDIAFLGWQARKINQDVYVVRNSYVRGSDTLGWLFEVNLSNEIIRPINYFKEDSSLLNKYGHRIDREFLTSYKFSKLQDIFKVLKSPFSDKDLKLLMETAIHREKRSFPMSADEMLLQIDIRKEQLRREELRKEFETLIPHSKKGK